MKKIFATAVLIASCMAVSAQAAAPRGWFITGSAQNDFDTGTEASTRVPNSTSAYVRAKSDSNGFATLMQTVDAAAYKGKRVRFSGYLRTKDAGKGALWMRVDDADKKSVAFDNMNDRAQEGDKPWQSFDVVLDVPDNARDIAFGVLLQNKGEVWADGLKFEVVGKDVPVTGAAHALSPTPVNLGFAE